MKRLIIASLMLIGTTGLAAAPAVPSLAFPANKVPGGQIQGPAGPLVQVHGWHCRRAWAPGWGWHRHPRACRGQYHNRRWSYRGHNRRWSYRGHSRRWSYERRWQARPRVVCWHNRWSQRVCRRRY